MEYRPIAGRVTFSWWYPGQNKVRKALERAIAPLADREISVEILPSQVKVSVMDTVLPYAVGRKYVPVDCLEENDEVIQRVVDDVLAWLAKGELIGWD